MKRMNMTWPNDLVLMPTLRWVLPLLITGQLWVDHFLDKNLLFGIMLRDALINNNKRERVQASSSFTWAGHFLCEIGRWNLYNSKQWVPYMNGGHKSYDVPTMVCPEFYWIVFSWTTIILCLNRYNLLMFPNNHITQEVTLTFCFISKSAFLKRCSLQGWGGGIIYRISWG